MALTATLTVQSSGLQFPVLAAVGPTLITLVMISFSSDGSGVTDDEGTPRVIETTLVTLVMLAEESEIISEELQIGEEKGSKAHVLEEEPKESGRGCLSPRTAQSANRPASHVV